MSARERDRLVLMNPGPVNADERVRAALAGPDMCHREPEFAALLTRVRSRLVQVCGGDRDWSAVVLTGSGTAAVEAAVVSAPPRNGTVLALDNGHYGQRMHDIAAAHGIATRRLELGWGNPLDLAALDAALAADSSITHVTVVHHETSTGMRNDVHAVAGLVHRHGRAVIVDAVSSVGADPLDLADSGLDWVAGSANKNIEGMPGLSFVCGRRTAFEALGQAPTRSYYLDLHRNFLAQQVNTAPAFTPGIPAFYALDTALELLLAEGVEARGRRYLALAERLRAGLERLGLDLLLPAGHRANSLTAVRLPDGVPYREMHDALRAAGFVIYAGQEHLAKNYFRLSTMGCMTTADVDDFTAALGAFLGQVRPPVPGASAADRKENP
ncbi:pyridoxal-phosphate-dependent aminotransferase family protein [Kitasatospora cheerisanensis]|uniref:2-aminoethylphosphonate--pyruvate transaminase n=2 Tax=Kitasatospora TaxID=2063 RepID=A0A066YL68_9ACTN|nr:aminotransferase class V-fold PLP-dependent enzyme [Kitasatospora cheerisanensis]AGZ94235.1 2-aminoethylphosphonate:pyruvate aminotransferase [Kitasatospora sp. NRRL F-6133]KDN81922.1 hypothetical protein KCH_63610 [Kitasatospora cheerisanensis KCTC 2395]